MTPTKFRNPLGPGLPFAVDVLSPGLIRSYCETIWASLHQGIGGLEQIDRSVVATGAGANYLRREALAALYAPRLEAHRETRALVAAVLEEDLTEAERKAVAALVRAMDRIERAVLELTEAA